MVTDVFIPSPWASSMISSQRSAPGLLGGDEVAHALNENLSTTAGNRIESRFAQRANHLDRIHPEQLGEEVDLARAEAVNVDRVIALDVLHQVEIPLERDVRVVPALDQYLHAAERLEPRRSCAPICSKESV